MLKKTYKTAQIILLLLLVIAPIQGLHAGQSSSNYDMKNPHQNIEGVEGVMSGGQPSKADLKELQENAYTTVINLRGVGEFSGFDEQSEVTALGMDYISIPISSPGDMHLENILMLDAAIKEAEGDVFIHCASGNRVGAMLALRAYEVENITSDQAMSLGIAAGMTGLQNTVKNMMVE